MVTAMTMRSWRAFQPLKRERTKRGVYATREEAQASIFDYIEMFYNSIRRHGHNDGLFTAQFENSFSCKRFISRKLVALKFNIAA